MDMDDIFLEGVEKTVIAVSEYINEKFNIKTDLGVCLSYHKKSLGCVSLYVNIPIDYFETNQDEIKKFFGEFYDIFKKSTYNDVSGTHEVYYGNFYIGLETKDKQLFWEYFYDKIK